MEFQQEGRFQKSENEKSKYPAWLILLFLVAVLGAVVIFIVGTKFDTKKMSMPIQGVVESVDLQNRSFVFEVSFLDEQSNDFTEKEYIVHWNEKTIFNPNILGFLEGGVVVVVYPSENQKGNDKEIIATEIELRSVPAQVRIIR